MKHFTLPLAALAVTAAAPSAQILSPTGADPGKRQGDNTTEYTTRSNLGTTAGRLGMQLTTAHWAGLRNPVTFTFRVQDQDASTQESFTFEVRAQDPASGFPDWLANPGAPIFAMLFTNPIGPAAPTSFLYTVTPAPAITLPGDRPFYLAWDLPVAPAWTADGLSVWMSAGAPFACGAPTPVCCAAAVPNISSWEVPRPGARQDVALSDTAAGPLMYAGDDRNHAHWISFAQGTPVLRALASNTALFCQTDQPNFGHAAMDPDVHDEGQAGRNDDIGWEVRGGFNFANGGALVFLTESAQDIPIPTGFGDLWINPLDRFLPLLMQGPVLLNAAGVGNLVVPLGPPASGPRMAVGNFGNLHAQALAFNAAATEFRLTNLVTMRFPLPAGTAFTIDAATPLNVPAGGNRNIKVQNDGKGDVQVLFLGPGNIQLGTMTVRERTTISTAVRGGLPPGTLNIRVTTPNTDPFSNNATTGLYVLLP